MWTDLILKKLFSSQICNLILNYLYSRDIIKIYTRKPNPFDCDQTWIKFTECEMDITSKEYLKESGFNEYTSDEFIKDYLCENYFNHIAGTVVSVDVYVPDEYVYPDTDTDY